MIQIAIQLDPQTNKLGIKTNAGNKQAVAVLLEAVKMLVGNIQEADEPRIIPASQLPRGI